MNQTVVLVAIGTVVAAFIFWPLLRRAGPPPAPPRTRGESARSPLPVSSAADELGELELDRQMCRIDEADYERLRARVEAGVGETVEPAIAEATREPEPAGTAPGARAEALVRRWRDSPRPRCPTCGERPEPGARYCSNCGAALGGP